MLKVITFAIDAMGGDGSPKKIIELLSQIYSAKTSRHKVPSMKSTIKLTR